MKKRLLGVLLACAMLATAGLATIGLSACKIIGNDQMTEETDGSDNEQVTGNKTDEETWMKSLSSAHNFTLQSDYLDVDPNPIIFKLDGNKLEQRYEHGNLKQIIVKENDDYTLYFTENGREWYKEPAGQEKESAFEIYISIPAFFAEHFDEFTYNNEKYTCAEMRLSINGEIDTFLNIEIVFVEDRIYSIDFCLVEEGYSMYYSLKNFGTTAAVEVPTKNIIDRT